MKRSVLIKRRKLNVFSSLVLPLFSLLFRESDRSKGVILLLHLFRGLCFVDRQQREREARAAIK